ncbi:YebC/PmpR family DNA-binding transcriptional regulator [Sediminicurvatus halobius]|uniref:Probable transcriptional regulatory protein DEM34_17890 n=1 Tax=Sediminicurvatus halobius TaxID=2182432 RepID=A0A2U2MWC2_9GAMM|nr:YebC/PmpR family DNA-binding transcriptional regulator [Spiribacter halobius]PWG61144.1 YebC/PmpR family DNA-binding transcriptional regulator [Spiribacter halobius]UEX78646.1 YebC/PmpR family DNA-binding transcriptional regulator [Spiribacter halobius]
MAGHSKWANIQHRKKAQDAKRGKIFTKMIREITVAARQGGDDPDANPRLRLAIDRALAVNMPKDKIERAAARGAGTDDGAAYEEARFEGYGPGGVAIMVDCMTDNRNRTVSEVRHAFSKHGGNLGTDGCVAFLFQQRGVLLFPPGTDEDALMEAALEAGAEDVVSNDDGSFEVLTAPEAFTAAREALTAAGLEPADAEVTMRPETTVAVGEDEGAKTLRLIERLEDLDDVQHVYTNADVQASAYEEA